MLGEERRALRELAPELHSPEGLRALEGWRRELDALERSIDKIDREALSVAAGMADLGARQTEGIPGSFVQHHMRRARGSAIFGASLRNPRRPAQVRPSREQLVGDGGISRMAEHVADGVRLTLGPSLFGINDWLVTHERRRKG